MSDFTPPPWEWVEDTFWGGYSGIVGPDNQEVLFPDHCNDGDSGAAWFDEYPSDADRRLVAAAPELYEVLAKATAYLKRINFYELLDDKLSAVGLSENLNLIEEMEATLALVDKETR